MANADDEHGPRTRIDARSAMRDLDRETNSVPFRALRGIILCGGSDITRRHGGDDVRFSEVALIGCGFRDGRDFGVPELWLDGDRTEQFGNPSLAPPRAQLRGGNLQRGAGLRRSLAPQPRRFRGPRPPRDFVVVEQPPDE